MNEEKIVAKLKDNFKHVYGNMPEAVYYAPGRVNLIGEHTDYNGGHVFPCALTLGTYAAVKSRDDKTLSLTSINIDENEINTFIVDDFEKKDAKSWTNYPRGVFWVADKKGYKLLHGLDIMFYGNIPAGSGLSSSASIEVLTGLIIKDTYGLEDVSSVDLALWGQDAENNYVGMNCGIMDQFASAMGKKDNAIFLDTETLEYTYAPLDIDGGSIVITNSMVKHELTSSGYNERRAQTTEALKRLCTIEEIKSLGMLSIEQFEDRKHIINDEVLTKRAKHAVYENQRTIQAVNALKGHNIDTFGELMHDAHLSMECDYEASCEEVDFLVHRSWDIPGVIGSRMTGGGFGGCLVSIVKNDSIDSFKEILTKEYKNKYDIKPEFYIVNAGEGARRIQ